jgi:hypothetical protein
LAARSPAVESRPGGTIPAANDAALLNPDETPAIIGGDLSFESVILSEGER